MRIAEFSAQWEGRTVDGVFALRRFLGAGESSSVFLTSYDTLPAAIKLVFTEPDTADAQLSRWRSAAKISHPHLLRIFTTGRCELDGIALLYVVMELAEENLSQVLPDRSLTAVETRAMLEPSLAALDHIHRQGFVHSHLKPSNIMAVDDRVKLSSDGLCRLATNCADPPSLYDPPERASGITAAGDIWSLGMTLVEVLTQRLPAAGLLPTHLPEPFAAIALHCLDPKPADRWTIPQIQQRLGTPPLAAVRKKRYVVPVGVMILLALLIVLVVGVMFKRSDTGVPPAIPPKTAPVEASKPPEPEPAKKVPPAKPPRTIKAPEPAPQPSVSSDQTQPMPDITEQARRTIHGRAIVEVTVDVDPSGRVTDAKLDHSGSKYLSASALKAVRQWKFKPVAADGRDIAQQWRVRFEFRSDGTKALPQRLSP